MNKLMSKSLNPMQLAIVYKNVVELTQGTEVAKDREQLKKIIKEEYHKLYPHSYMPINDKEETLTSIYNNYGRIEELAIELGIKDIDNLLNCIAMGARAKSKTTKKKKEN